MLASALALGGRVLAMLLGYAILELQFLVNVVFNSMVFWGLFVHHSIVYKTIMFCMGFSCLSSVHQLQQWKKKLVQRLIRYFYRSCNTCSYVREVIVTTTINDFVDSSEFCGRTSNCFMGFQSLDIFSGDAVMVFGIS